MRTPNRFRPAFADALAYMRVEAFDVAFDSMQMDGDFPSEVWTELRPLVASVNEAIICHPDRAAVMRLTVGELLGWGNP